MNNCGIEYHVFKDKGIVVCKLWGCKYIPNNRIRKHRPGMFGFNYERYFIDDVYVGVAKCAAEDTFDEEYGKKLALTKARAKRCRAINNAISRYLKDVKRAIRDIERYEIHNVPDVERV